jgi:hypothetical protein
MSKKKETTNKHFVIYLRLRLFMNKKTTLINCLFST